MISLGIDIGTTSLCIVSYDSEKRRVVHEEKTDNRFLDETSYTQDADEIAEKIKKLLLAEEKWRKAQYGESEEGNITAAGISAQMHGILYVDKDGRAVSPLYTWKNQWGNEDMGNSCSYAGYLEKCLGMPFHTGYGSVTHFYLQKKGRIPETAAAFVDIGQYVAMRLAQTCKISISATMAASMGGFCLESRKFELEKLKEAGVDISYYPEAASGQAKIEGTGSGLYVIGDNQASFLGAVKDRETTVSINVGTGSQVSVYGENLIPSGGLEIRPAEEKGYLYVGASLNGGKVYEKLERFFEEVCYCFTGKRVNCYERMESLAGEKTETSLKTVPSLYGGREDIGKEAGIYGITPENFHPGDLIRSYVSGMAEELYEMYLLFPEELRKRKDRIAASGNGIRKNRLMQEEIQRIFKLPVIFSECEEEAAAGAALYALAAERERGTYADRSGN